MTYYIDGFAVNNNCFAFAMRDVSSDTARGSERSVK